MGASADLAVSGSRDRNAPPRRRLRAGSTLLVVAVTGAVLLAGAVALVPALVGASSRTVLSGSMEPALPVGSIVIVRPEPATSIRPGDIITFADRAAVGHPVVTHRVVAVRDGQRGPVFTTQGDANNSPDPGLTAAADVQGVVWYHLPWIGDLRAMLVGPAAMFYLAGGLLVLVAAHFLVPVGASSREGRR